MVDSCSMYYGLVGVVRFNRDTVWQVSITVLLIPAKPQPKWHADSHADSTGRLSIIPRKPISLIKSYRP